MTSLDADGVQLDTEAFRSLCGHARELIGHLERSSVQRVVVELGDARLEIERAQAPTGAAPPADAPVAAEQPGPAFSVSPGARGASGAFAAITGDVDRRIPVLAPLVGTFYAAPQPGAPPFVEVGRSVEPGDTVCIVEAMKLMNEVAAGEAGTVVELAVENGERVEYEQVLMYLEPLDD